MSDGVVIEAKLEALNATLRRLVARDLPKAIDTAATKMALDVVKHTMKGLTHGGDGSPRRVDTGRLRAAWRLGAKAAKIPTIGLRGGVTGTASAAGSLSTDGYGSRKGSGMRRRITVGNAVEYAPAVEFGTKKMAPGNHLQRAMVITRRETPKDESEGSIQSEIVNAWEGA